MDNSIAKSHRLPENLSTQNSPPPIRETKQRRTIKLNVRNVKYVNFLGYTRIIRMLIPRWTTTYEIRILIQQQNLYVLPYTELIRREPRDAVGNTILDVNNIAFMFNEIRYELHDIKINHSTNIRLRWRTTWAYPERKVRRWKTQIGNMKIIINTGTVHKATTITLLFCEDYKRVVIHENYEIKIIKISNNITSIFVTEDTMNKIFEL
jgi:hypothetical protein